MKHRSRPRKERDAEVMEASQEKPVSKVVWKGNRSLQVKSGCQNICPRELNKMNKMNEMNKMNKMNNFKNWNKSNNWHENSERCRKIMVVQKDKSQERRREEKGKEFQKERESNRGKGSERKTRMGNEKTREREK